MLGNGRSEPEKTFALNFIENADEIMDEYLKADQETADKASEDEPLDLSEMRLTRTFGSESTDAGMFWTFAPYVYKNLPDQSAKEKIKKIFNWATVKETPHRQLNEDQHTNTVHLKGLGETYHNLGGMYYLTTNPDDLTHKFTDQEARKLVEEGVFD